MSIIEELLDEARVRQSIPPVALRRLLRERAGLTQAELARAVGVDRATVSRWEAGIRSPRGGSRAAYGAVLQRLGDEALAAARTGAR
jgi:transcriptional regulator with XRE-family HTH domain